MLTQRLVGVRSRPFLRSQTVSAGDTTKRENASRLHPVHTSTCASNAKNKNILPGGALAVTMRDPPVTHLRFQPEVPTPVNAARLKTILQGYDNDRVNLLTSGFTSGFHIPVFPNIQAVQSNNHLSAEQQFDLIQTDINIELTAGRIAGPFTSPPYNNFFVSPIGMVPKKEPLQFRRIHDLSFPPGESVNDHIPRDMCTVQYETLDNITEFVLAYGHHAFIAKADIEKAFRILPLHPSSYHLMGFKWDGKYFYDMCLPMGCSFSCKLFEEFSTAIQWVLSSKFKMYGISHILDDFMFVDASYEACNRKLECFLALARWLNIPIKSEKTFRPQQVITVHGIEVDSIRMEMRLPQDKIIKAKVQLEHLQHTNRTTLRTLQALIGLLNFTCRVVVPGRAFLRRMIALTRGVMRPHHHIRINNEAKADIAAWLCFINDYNGVTLLRERLWIASPKIHLFTDAAASLGYAAVLGSTWFQGTWPSAWKSLSIAFLELFPIATALELWGYRLQNKCIILHTDNLSIVSVINAQTSKDLAIMYLVRRFVISSLKYNIMFNAVHIPGHLNCTADLLSRSQIQKALAKAPHLSKSPTDLPQEMLPKNIQLRKSWKRHCRIAPGEHMGPLSEPSTISSR
jgi:hypothetical protein